MKNKVNGTILTGIISLCAGAGLLVLAVARDFILFAWLGIIPFVICLMAFSMYARTAYLAKTGQLIGGNVQTGYAPQTREIIKEIVKVRCSHCGMLVEYTSSTCSNCGAIL